VYIRFVEYSLLAHRILPNRHKSTHKVLFCTELSALYDNINYLTHTLMLGTQTGLVISSGYLNFWPTLYTLSDPYFAAGRDTA